MKRLVPAALALLLLAGCGASPTAAPKKATSKAAPAAAAKGATSAIAEKGLLGLFKLAHASLDADENGSLSAEEFAASKDEEILPGLPAFEVFDKDKDKAISLAEFTDKAILKGKAAIFTDRVAKAFAELDKNKDKSLTKAEMAESDVAFPTADGDKNQKVSAAEFELAYADAVSKPPAK